MHGTEFKHRYQLAVFAYSLQADEESVGRLFVVIGFFGFDNGDIIQFVDDFFFIHFEAAAIETAENFGMREDAVFAFGNIKIKLTQVMQFGHNAVPEEIEGIKDVIEREEFPFQYIFFTGEARLAAGDKDAAIGQQLVDFIEILIDITYVV